MAKIGLERSGIDIDTLIGECVTAGMPEHGGMDLEPNLGFVAGAGASSLAKPKGVNGPPRSEAKTKGEADWRFSFRSARKFIAQEDAWLPAAFGAAHMHRGGLELDRRPLQVAEFRLRPCRKPIRIMVASRWPWRLPLDTLIRRSTSCSVRCSRSRPMFLLLSLRSATVRNSETGVTSRRLDLAMIFAPDRKWTGRNLG
jgi:hypothetical protein